MQRALILPVAAALLLAGCAARGDEDPFAYTRKPLYTGTFDLASLGENHTTTQRFWVTDGSINQVRVVAWVNATAGSATVSVYDPGGNLVMRTTGHDVRTLNLQLGDWRVVVEGAPGVAGRADVLAFR